MDQTTHDEQLVAALACLCLWWLSNHQRGEWHSSTGPYITPPSSFSPLHFCCCYHHDHHGSWSPTSRPATCRHQCRQGVAQSEAGPGRLVAVSCACPCAANLFPFVNGVTMPVISWSICTLIESLLSPLMRLYPGCRIVRSRPGPGTTRGQEMAMGGDEENITRSQTATSEQTNERANEHQLLRYYPTTRPRPHPTAAHESPLFGEIGQSTRVALPSPASSKIKRW
jgi:hypothetical protein